ncbi:2-oxoglutarate-dependent ethylene/succinate-forming enzyme [Xylariales sp. PMI_506]|nr:2-oxoglutarate-dependent ethylene/succinate-forming enzyme [Xylariales sp. PMI_506]
MPPGYQAKVMVPETFVLPDRVTGTFGDRTLGKVIIDTWRRDGILQIASDREGQQLQTHAYEASRQFFSKPQQEKASCVDSQSYAGYIASGEEITDGIADFSEIFTVTKDLPLSDPRVQAKWPCHGPCPWPDHGMREPVTKYMEWLGTQGEKLLKLIELGLGIPEGSLSRYTNDGWHHSRILRFPPVFPSKDNGNEGRGIGSHTDYGLLVIASQDHVGGLFIRPPHEQENYANWEKSTAGFRQGDDGWYFIPPVPNVHTVFLGDMMQYLTNNKLTATLHKVGLNTRERFAFAYFHEPSFQAVLKPLTTHDLERGANGSGVDNIHYGTHFTNMFMRNYPDRITTRRIIEEGRYEKLSEDKLRMM